MAFFKKAFAMWLSLSKLKRNLIVLSGVLVLVLVFIQLAPSMLPVPTPSPTPPYTIEQLRLLQGSRDNLATFTVSLKNPQGGEEPAAYTDLAFTQTESGWILEGKDPAKTESGSIRTLAWYVANIDTLTIISENPTPENLIQWGLAEPEVIVASTYKDSTTHELKLGIRIPVGQQYYMMIDDNPFVYAINQTYFTYYTHGASYYDKTTRVSLDPAGLTEVDLSHRLGLEDILIKKTEPDALLYNPYRMMSPYFGRSISITPGVRLFEKVAAMTTIWAQNEKTVTEEVINWGDYTQYGFTDNSPQLSARDKHGSYAAYRLGGFVVDGEGKTDTSKRYCYFERDNMIKQVYASDVEFFFTDPYTLCEKQMSLLYINSIDKITVSGKFGTFDVGMTYFQKPNPSFEVDPTQPETIEDFTVKINDKDLTVEEGFNAKFGREFYRNALIEIYIHGVLPKDPADVGAIEPALLAQLEATASEVTILYERRTEMGFNDISLEMVPYGHSYYAIKQNGVFQPFYVEKANVLFMYSLIDFYDLQRV